MAFAYYTCFFGSDTNWTFMIPPLPTSEHDCYFFTNNPRMFGFLEHSGWKRVWVDIPIHNDNLRDCESTKELRSCPHRFKILQPYEYLCWFDCKLKVDHSRIINHLEQLKTSNKSFVLTLHPIQYPTVWGEYDSAMGVKKYALQKDQVLAYIQKKLSDGYPETLTAHYCGGFHIRKMSDPRIVDFGEEWYSNIQQCGIEDQISLQFVYQGYKDLIVSLAYQDCWTYA
jgi:hypothetical protein